MTTRLTGPGDVPLPLVPSTDGARLAVVLRAVEWELDNVAHDLPAGRCGVERLRGMAATLRRLADHLDAASGIVPGEREQHRGDDPASR